MRPVLLPLLLAAACATTRPAATRTEVKLELKVPLPIVLVSVDGQPKQPFILDTGVGLTTVSCPGRPVGATTRLPTVQLGDLVFRDVTAQCADLPKDLGARGILSPQDAFRGALVELDGRSLAIRLYRDLDEADWRSLVGEPVHSVPLTWSEGVPTVVARVGEASLAMRLDSGAGACGLPRAELDRLGYAGQDEVTLPLAVGASKPGREQLFVLDGPGSVGFPWFVGRRAALSADRKALLFTDRP